MQLLDKDDNEGSGGGGTDIYHREGSGTPNYVDDPENEGLFREIVNCVGLVQPYWSAFSRDLFLIWRSCLIVAYYKKTLLAVASVSTAFSSSPKLSRVFV